MHNDDGDHHRKACNFWGDFDGSFNCEIIDASMWLWYEDQCVCSGECSNSAAKKEHRNEAVKHLMKEILWKKGCGCEWCRWRGRGQRQGHRQNKKA